MKRRIDLLAFCNSAFLGHLVALGAVLCQQIERCDHGQVAAWEPVLSCLRTAGKASSRIVSQFGSWVRNWNGTTLEKISLHFIDLNYQNL